jgi:hypothetical protein
MMNSYRILDFDFSVQISWIDVQCGSILFLLDLWGLIEAQSHASRKHYLSRKETQQ